MIAAPKVMTVGMTLLALQVITKMRIPRERTLSPMSVQS